MERTAWFRRAGPGIAAVGTVALMAATTLGAPARAWQPPECADAPLPVVGTAGAWYRTDASLVDGVLVGQRVSVGHARGERARFLELDAESFASGPFEGVVLTGTDDGTRSRLALVDVAAGCVRPAGESADIVRHATLAPSRDALYEHRIERGTRRDLGIWRRSLEPGIDPVRVLPPIEPDDRFGPTWRTALSWSDDGTELVVESCGEVACRVRLYDVVARTTRTIARPDLGDVVGVAAGSLVAHGACRGLPCPLRSVRIDSGATTTLDDSAGQAVLVREPDGRPAIVYEADVSGRVLRRVDPDGGGVRDLAAPVGSVRLVPGAARAASASDAADGWILFAPDGRLPLDGPVAPILRRIDDGRSAGLEEVLR